LKIRIRVFASLRKDLGWNEKEYEINFSTFGDFIKTTKELRSIIMDKDGTNLNSFYKVLVNGRDLDFLKGLGTVLKDKDEIQIFPPVGGG
jgi:molybdopterin synthase sulfur carrier subunit